MRDFVTKYRSLSHWLSANLEWSVLPGEKEVSEAQPMCGSGWQMSVLGLVRVSEGAEKCSREQLKSLGRKYDLKFLYSSCKVNLTHLAAVWFSIGIYQCLVGIHQHNIHRWTEDCQKLDGVCWKCCFSSITATINNSFKRYCTSVRWKLPKYSERFPGIIKRARKMWGSLPKFLQSSYRLF